MSDREKELKKLAVYVHIPFCVHKCAYCDFLSAPATDELKQQYIEALMQEILLFHRFYPEQSRRYQVETIFFGGGTPSILQEDFLAQVLQVLREVFRVSECAEITVECNPGTLTREKLFTYRLAGVNRLSIGLQSADDTELKRLGRIHTYQDFLKSYHMARECGFDNINIDLMSALPGQTLESWENTLARVVGLKPEHISAYSLILEEGTTFYERYVENAACAEDEGKQNHTEEIAALPDEDTEREMYARTESILRKAGYERYEISNYARTGRECRHNLSYWNGTEYIGFGLGAASFFAGERFCRIRRLEQYIRTVSRKEDTRIERLKHTRKDAIEEFMFLGLRCMRGISKEEFREKFGMDIRRLYGEALEKYLGYGMLAEDEKRIWLTAKGIDVSNVIFADFLLEEDVDEE